MGVSLNEIVKRLKDAKCTKKNSEVDAKVQLIYAFNGTGKTRLSKEFRSIESPQIDENIELEEIVNKKVLYYNAFTEDLFYWDNDLQDEAEPKLKIHPNSFTKFILEEQGQDGSIITNFQHYTNEKLTPHFNAMYSIKDKNGKNVIIEAFTEITFSYERGNDENSKKIKISKGEESNFIWCVFYSLLEQVIEELNENNPSNRGTNLFDKLEYIFIDDPVSSLDENNLIKLAVNLAELIKFSKSDLKFIITTHNPLFFNVLYSIFKKGAFKSYILKKNENGEYDLVSQSNESPFSYHLFLKSEIEKAIKEDRIQKYHFNYLRNILEKTSIFLGYNEWGELLKELDGDTASYDARTINLFSHSKYSGDEVAGITDQQKILLKDLIERIKKFYKFK